MLCSDFSGFGLLERFMAYTQSCSRVIQIFMHNQSHLTTCIEIKKLNSLITDKLLELGHIDSVAKL